MIRFLSLLTIVVILTSSSASGQKIASETKLRPNKVKSVAIIAERCAIIVHPDNKRIKLMKKGISANDYMTLVSDNQYYMMTATNFLDSVRIRQIERLSSGVLRFRNSSGQYFNVSLDSFDWGIILFNGRTKPITAEVTNMEEEYRSYMKK